MPNANDIPPELAVADTLALSFDIRARPDEITKRQIFVGDDAPDWVRKLVRDIHGELEESEWLHSAIHYLACYLADHLRDAADTDDDRAAWHDTYGEYGKYGWYGSHDANALFSHWVEVYVAGHSHDVGRWATSADAERAMAAEVALWAQHDTLDDMMQAAWRRQLSDICDQVRASLVVAMWTPKIDWSKPPEGMNWMNWMAADKDGELRFYEHNPFDSIEPTPDEPEETADTESEDYKRGYEAGARAGYEEGYEDGHEVGREEGDGMSKYRITKRVYAGPNCEELRLGGELMIHTSSDISNTAFGGVYGWQYTAMGLFNTIEDARAYAAENGWDSDTAVRDKDYEIYWRSEEALTAPTQEDETC